MKWGGNSHKAADKITKTLSKIFGVKGISVLITITAFALLSGAVHKWT